MWWSFCSPKGGVGTSTVAAVVALELARTSTELSVVIADFCGDQPDLLGVDALGKPGVTDWLCADGDVPIGSLDNVMLDVAPGVRLLPMGQASVRNADPARIVQLTQGLGPEIAVVADVGVVGEGPTSSEALLAASGSATTLVTRACYLALRRAAVLPVAFDTVVEVVEPGRSLRTLDIELVLSQPVTARVRTDPAIARTIDAGLLLSRRPRSLRRSAKRLIDEVVGSTDRAAARTGILR